MLKLRWRCISLENVRQLTIDPRFEEVKILEVGEHSLRSFQQFACSEEELSVGYMKLTTISFPVYEAWRDLALKVRTS